MGSGSERLKMPTKTHTPVTLDRVPVGASSEITGIRTDCERAGRLASLGFIPGRRAKITRLAPLGDPILVKIDGQEISLRRTEASLILVRDIRS